LQNTTTTAVVEMVPQVPTGGGIDERKQSRRRADRFTKSMDKD
jgi:hypothetical protein